jgi:iron complex outermembrane receptor protein
VNLFLALRRDRYRFSVTDELVSESNPDDSGRRMLSATSVAAGAGVKVGRGLELYANLGTAFETPTTTELANRPDGSGGFNPELEPERTLGGEAGVRAVLAGWQAEVTLFRADVSDKLIPFEVPALPGRQFFRNAGRARHQGFELSTGGRILRPLELRAAYTRLDVRFREYMVGEHDYSGLRVPGVAGHRFDLEAEVLATSGWRLLLRARRNGSVAATDGNDATARAYMLLGARAAHQGLTMGALRITPHAGVENLLDESYTAAVAVNAAGGRYFEPGPGRYLYFGLSFARSGVNDGIPAGR